MSILASGNISVLVRELEASLECVSCGFTLQDPFVSTECLHVACRLCFINMVCPMCQHENSESALVRETRLVDAVFACRQLKQALEASEKGNENSNTIAYQENNKLNGRPHDGNSTKDCTAMPPVGLNGEAQKTLSGVDAATTAPSPASVNSKRPSTSSKLNKKNLHGETPLHVACKKGNLDRVKELLAQGATPNTQDNAGWTPLHEVAQAGSLPIAQLLLENGARVDVASECRTLPLHDAVLAGHPEVIKLLLEHGADPRAANSDGQTALDLASYNDTIKNVLLDFIAHHPDPPTAPPPVPARSPVLMSSSLKGQDVQAFTSCVALIGAQVSSKFDSKVTHLVVATDDSANTQRTLKFLQCVAAGCWIVSAGWAHRCLAMGCWVDEAPFEVNGCRQFPGHGAPRKARENRASGSPGLLTGFSIYFAPVDSPLVPSTEELSTMCEMAGAIVLKREPKPGTYGRTTNPYVSAGSLLASHSTFVVGGPATALRGGVLWLSRDWLIDSISKFELHDVTL